MSRDLFIGAVLALVAIALATQLDLLGRWRAQRARRQIDGAWRALAERLELSADPLGRYLCQAREGRFELSPSARGVTVRSTVEVPTLGALTLFPQLRGGGAAPAAVTAPAQARAKALWAWFDSAPERWIEEGRLSALLAWAEATPAVVHQVLEEMARAQRAIEEE